MNTKTFIPLLTVLAAGCALAERDEAEDIAVSEEVSGDYGGYDGPSAIESASASCLVGDTDRWHYAVRTNGFADVVELHVVETGQRREQPLDPSSEVHEMTNGEYDASGAWDGWELTLLTVPDLEENVPGATTQWGCEAVADTLGWMAIMHESNAPDVTHCAVWGHRSDAWFNVELEYDCACVDVDGDCS